MTWAAIGIIAAVTALDVAAFWWLTKPPAGVEPNPPKRLPLPGPTPAHPHETPPDVGGAAGAPVPPPPPEASTRCFDFRAAGWDCGCLVIRDHLHSKQRDDLCERHKFAAHWNERLRQS